MAAPKKRREAERELKKKGFEPVKGRGKGSHEVWKDASGKTVTVPKHGDEIAAGTWRSIEKQTQQAEAAKRAAEAAEAQRLATQGQAQAGRGRSSGGQGQRSGQQSNQQNQQQPKKRRFFGR